MKDTHNGTRAAAAGCNQTTCRGGTARYPAQTTASTGEIFSAAWPGPAPACCGRWRAACRRRSCLPPPLAQRQHDAAAGAGFSFVQISDSHIGFNKAANQDVTGTLKLALDKINAPAGHAGFAAAHRRYQPLVQAGGVRHRAADHQGVKAGADLLCSGRARYRNRRWRALSRALRQGHAWAAAGTALPTKACTLSG